MAARHIHIVSEVVQREYRFWVGEPSYISTAISQDLLERAGVLRLYLLHGTVEST